jgi:hypothetical protein
MMEAIRSSETSVLTRATQRHIPEDDVLQVEIPFTNDMARALIAMATKKL